MYRAGTHKFKTMKSLVTIICAVILGFSACFAGESGSPASTTSSMEPVRPVRPVERDRGVSSNSNNENSFRAPAPIGVYKSRYNNRIVVFDKTVKIVFDGNLSWWNISKCSDTWMTIEDDNWTSYNIRIVKSQSGRDFLDFDHEQYYKTEEE